MMDCLKRVIEVMPKNSMRRGILLFLSFLVFSGSGAFCKLASLYPFLSFFYILYFLCVIVTLGVYAVLWQKILTFLPLNKAFLCKSVCIIFTLFFSHFFFSEQITCNNIIGAACIIFGLLLLVWKK